MKKIMTISAVISVFIFAAACSKKLVETSFAPEQAKYKILIAGDSSEFKDLIRSKLIETYKNTASINVISIKKLNKEDVGSVDAVIIMDTCLAWTGFNPTMKSFMKLPENRKKTVLFITAGDPDWTYRYEEVDAITSASNLEQEDDVFKRIKSELNKILNT